MTTLTAGLNRNKATLWKRLLVRRQIAPNLNAGELVVIEAGAAQARIVQLEPKGLDQMQSAAGVRTESDDVTGIGDNIGCAFTSTSSLHIWMANQFEITSSYTVVAKEVLWTLGALDGLAC